MRAIDIAPTALMVSFLSGCDVFGGGPDFGDHLAESRETWQVHLDAAQPQAEFVVTLATTAAAVSELENSEIAIVAEIDASAHAEAALEFSAAGVRIGRSDLIGPFEPFSEIGVVGLDHVAPLSIDVCVRVQLVTSEPWDIFVNWAEYRWEPSSGADVEVSIHIESVPCA